MAIVVDTGLAAMAKLINGVDSLSPFTYMANGSGSTDEAISQTALITENTLYGAARKLATCSYEETGVSKWVAMFTFSGSVTINELGIFNASSAGIMLLRHKLASAKSYTDGESVEVTLTNTMSRV